VKPVQRVLGRDTRQRNAAGPQRVHVLKHDVDVSLEEVLDEAGAPDDIECFGERESAAISKDKLRIGRAETHLCGTRLAEGFLRDVHTDQSLDSRRERERQTRRSAAEFEEFCRRPAVRFEHAPVQAVEELTDEINR